MKKARPKINLNKLREIGWSHWDPIGLNDRIEGWKDEPFEDEYDTYLVKAARMLRNQRSMDDVVEYLFFVETEYMGLGVGPNEAYIRERLARVVQAIADEPFI
ncbi:hypothetical protein [Roseobacter ponti]|uniref:Uncharacterized protein n=1 Tax=Roseobacter ponti TaxID=1891787 RepID=A0A858T0S5_9RHOB|nr:hypothetical protein [Roseobacter ponti]QJF52816.1 hypothetical protein G3256_17370 [Roseobacter ponti]